MLSVLFFIQFFFIVQAQRGGNNVNCKTPDNQSGLCLPVQACRTMQEFLSKLPRPTPPDIRDKLKLYQCGSSGGKPKICCPEKSISFDKPAEEAERFEFPDVSNHRNLGLIPKNCGHQDTVEKVVGGNATVLNEFPWMALLSYQTPSGPSFKCGATIINERTILTAAHCVTNLGKLKLIGVRVGEHNIRTVKDCEAEEDGEEFCNPPVQDLKIEKVILHQQYDARSHANDIALIRVSKIDLTQENAVSVCLPLMDLGNFNYTNKRMVVTGWGFTETGKPSNVLLKAELPIVPVKACAEKYKKTTKITEKQLCAGGKMGTMEVDSCNGDSGGPLHSLSFLFDQSRFIQQGIVSFGPADCGKLPLPGVYTRVASYMDWILDHMEP